jgi:RND family efflux transporter MFP subunit
MPDATQTLDRHLVERPHHATPEEHAASPFSTEHPKPASSKGLALGGVAIAALLGAVLVVGVSSRLHAKADLHAVSQAASVPTVNFVLPQGSAGGSLVLPGRLQAWSDAPVYARTNGYLRRWYVDIGDHVRAGQVLATIDTPEVDQQLAAANAALATAKANQDLAATTSARWDRLLKVHAVSAQEADQYRGNLAARNAETNEQVANVARLKALTGFQQIIAPFDGVVTSRNTDIGALIVAGDARATPLFSVADNSRLRLYVSVPQNYASSFRPGMTARFTTPDHPDQQYTAVLERTADAVNANSGSMLIQLTFDNRSGVLKPGAYAQVTLPTADPKVAASAGPVRIPSSALLFRREGTAVAVVGDDGRVSIRPVQIARDYGAELAIGSGLSTSDRVIDSPSDAVSDGDRVHPVLEKTAAHAHA